SRRCGRLVVPAFVAGDHRPGHFRLRWGGDDMSAADAARVDAESRVSEADHLSLRLWLRLLTCTTMIERCVRERLRERFDMTLPRFDLMAQLARAPKGLRMSDLSRRLMVTGGN